MHSPDLMPVNVPEHPSLAGLEATMTSRWEREETYFFNRETAKSEVFSIDTPPPTASGSLHVGHMFSYTQTDTLARYQRMKGKNVFYPMGWDDNGLPTERRVQNYYGVRCDPNLPYDPKFVPADRPPKNERDFARISRRNFIELCERLAAADEKVFEDLFKKLGLSVDWSLSYRTVDAHSRAISQRAFLKNLTAGDAYMAEAPTLWDVTFKTAVAQAELEDRERPGAYHRVGFTSAVEGEKLYVETTRPELIPAAVALLTHPDDSRYAHLVGTNATSPLFGVEVPVLAHRLARPEKGSGLVMVSTFGDLTDVQWWRELELPTRTIVGHDGRLRAAAPWITGEEERRRYAELSEKTVAAAQKTIVRMLREAGLLDGDPKPTVHPVNFYEKGDKPLEIVSSRQWYLRNGGRDRQLRDRFLAQGAKIQWHPEFMRSRYDNWVGGLNGDWLVSRQRFFGVPIPVWYPLDSHGRTDYDHPILPRDSALPVDPAAEPAPGYVQEQRGVAGGFIGDPDVLDTWATSSLTPHIIGGWSTNNALFDVIFPFDVRPQAHEIIRTWLFSTVVRAEQLQNELPWKAVTISGWVLDPDRKKMSKSKGNVIVPTDVLKEYGADAVRYWAAGAKLGADTTYEISQIKIGRRLAIKLLNASKLILDYLEVKEPMILKVPADYEKITQPLDRAFLSALMRVVEDSTRAFEAYESSRALSLTESFFWQFTDDYLELVKDRAYGNLGEAGQQSALHTLATALDIFIRLFAPFLPFVTEEIWSWWRPGSIHSRKDGPHWPRSVLPAGDEGDTAVAFLETVADCLSGLRKAKSEAKVKQRTEVLSAVIHASREQSYHIEAALEDIKAAANARDISINATAEMVNVTDVHLDIPRWR